MQSQEASMLEKWSQLLTSPDIGKENPIPNSLRELTDIYPAYQTQLKLVLDKILVGATLYEAFINCKDSFRATTILLVGVGEESGSLDATLKKAGELIRFEDQYKPEQHVLEEILFCYSTGTMVQAGTSILDLFTNLANFSNEVAFSKSEQASKSIIEEIRLGGTLYDAMSIANQEIPFFRPSTTYLANIGEESGDVDKTLLKASEMLQLQKQYKLKPQEIQEILFYYSLGTLLEAGIPMTRSVGILADLSNTFYPSKSVLDNISKGLKSGKLLHEAMAKYDNYFSKEITGRIKNAEEQRTVGIEMLKISQDLQKKYCPAKQAAPQTKNP